MGLYKDIDTDFARRTLKIIEQYDRTKTPGLVNFEVTLLVNCLVGLLILPHSRRISAIPNLAIDKLGEWSIEASFITSWGIMKKAETKDLRTLVRRLRNSVAHFRIEAKGSDEDIEYLRLSDRNGFDATIPVANLKAFVTKFAASISTQ